MKISSVNVRILDIANSNLKAVASVVFDNQFCVHDIKIVYGKHGYFISLPSHKDKLGNMRDVAHPVSQEFRQELQDAILKEYENTIARITANVDTIAKE